MSISDYDEVAALWRETEGVGVPETRDEIAFFLDRNPGLSLVARSTDGQLAGAVLCGHDGRRGYIYHLAVATAFRKQGLATVMLGRCLDSLHRLGLKRCTLFVFAHNADGQAFWKRAQWLHREDLMVMQMVLDHRCSGEG